MNLIQYRLFCQTENEYVYVWAQDSDPVPTLCPHNTADTIQGTAVISQQVTDTIATDNQGASLSVPKLCPTGWHFELNCITFTSSLLNSVISNDWTNTASNDGTLTFYDVNGNILTDQPSIDSSCVKTQLDWLPAYDYYLLGGMMKLKQVPASSTYLSVGVATNIPYSLGGSRPLVSNFDISMANTQEPVQANGRSPKSLLYNNGIGSNRLSFCIYHTAGQQTTLQFLAEMYRQ